MNLHLEGFGSSGNGLAYVPETKQSNRLFGELHVHAVGRAGRVGPQSPAQMPVGIGERHVALQQRRHHILGDGMFVAKAVAHDG